MYTYVSSHFHGTYRILRAISLNHSLNILQLIEISVGWEGFS